jgi:hypothetical protein
VDFPSADGAIEVWIIAAVQCETAGALTQGIHDDIFRELNQFTIVFKRASRVFEHLRRALIVTTQSPLLENANGRGVHALTFFGGNGVNGTDKFSIETLHDLPSSGTEYRVGIDLHEHHHASYIFTLAPVGS